MKRNGGKRNKNKNNTQNKSSNNQNIQKNNAQPKAHETAEVKTVIVQDIILEKVAALTVTSSPGQQPVAPPPATHDIATILREHETCIICTSALSLSSLAVIESCSHAFCYLCIKKWRNQRWECPLCLKKFSMLLTNYDANSGQFQKEELAAPQIVNDDSSQFDCLESSYFIEEIDKLLRSTENLYKELARLRLQKKSWDYSQESDWTQLESLICTLNAYKQDILSGSFFEPYLVLQELYQIQESLNMLLLPVSQRRQAPKAAPLQSSFPSSRMNTYYEEQTTEYYEEDYYYDDDEEEEDDYYEDDYDGGRKGRKGFGNAITYSYNSTRSYNNY